jgi:hypothetical protein
VEPRNCFFWFCNCGADTLVVSGAARYGGLALFHKWDVINQAAPNEIQAEAV